MSGKVVPSNASETIWAISGNDSIRTNVLGGSFAFTAKPGIWKIFIDRKEPFKDAVLERWMLRKVRIQMSEK